MDRIALITGDTFIYWSAIVLALAAACGICLYLAIYLWESGNGLAGAVSVPLFLELGILGGRFLHWYCHPDSYESLRTAMTDLAQGEFALIGVFAGVLITALLLRLTRISRDLPQMLDAIAIGASAAIGIGRLASLYTNADRGMVLEGLTSLPLAYPAVDAVTGLTQYRLATFFLQAIAAGAIFLVLLVVFVPGKLSKRLPSGDTALIFCSLYGASQAVLDSTRYDSLFFRSNGFVSIVQIFAAIGVVVPLVFFSWRRCRKIGWRWWYSPLWLAASAGLGIAGYMEYYVQRHGDQAAFAYRNMTAGLAVTVGITLLFWLSPLLRKKA